MPMFNLRDIEIINKKHPEGYNSFAEMSQIML